MQSMALIVPIQQRWTKTALFTALKLLWQIIADYTVLTGCNPAAMIQKPE